MFNDNEKYREIVKNFRLLDDTYMTKFFDGQIKETQFVLRIILNDDSLIVKSVTA